MTYHRLLGKDHNRIMTPFTTINKLLFIPQHNLLLHTLVLCRFHIDKRMDPSPTKSVISATEIKQSELTDEAYLWYTNYRSMPKTEHIENIDGIQPHMRSSLNY